VVAHGAVRPQHLAAGLLGAQPDANADFGLHLPVGQPRPAARLHRQPLAHGRLRRKVFAQRRRPTPPRRDRAGLRQRRRRRIDHQPAFREPRPHGAILRRIFPCNSRSGGRSTPTSRASAAATASPPTHRCERRGPPSPTPRRPSRCRASSSSKPNTTP